MLFIRPTSIANRANMLANNCHFHQARAIHWRAWDKCWKYSIRIVQRYFRFLFFPDTIHHHFKILYNVKTTQHSADIMSKSIYLTNSFMCNKTQDFHDSSTWLYINEGWDIKPFFEPPSFLVWKKSTIAWYCNALNRSLALPSFKCHYYNHASESICSTVVDTHYCGGEFCELLWCILRTVVDTHYRGGLLCLMWWVIMLDVVGYYSGCDGVSCVMWWISTTVVGYCAWSSGLLCLMWWVIILDVVASFA